MPNGSVERDPILQFFLFNIYVFCKLKPKNEKKNMHLQKKYEKLF